MANTAEALCFFWRGVDGCDKSLDFSSLHVQSHFLNMCCGAEYKFCNLYQAKIAEHAAAINPLRVLDQANADSYKPRCPFWGQCGAMWDVSNKNHTKHYKRRCCKKYSKCDIYRSLNKGSGGGE